MNLRKILLSVFSIGVVALVAVLATQAFFSDTEKSEGNTFVAGSLDLKVDNTSYGFNWNDPFNSNPVGEWRLNQYNSWNLTDLTNTACTFPNPEYDPENPGETPQTISGPCLFFSFADLKPGDYGEDTISLHVQNDSWACMQMTLTETPENGVNSVEAAVPDTTTGANEGELQNYLHFAFWRDDGDNVYEEGEGPLLFNGLASELNGQWKVLADSTLGGQQNQATPLPGKEEGISASIGKVWCFGELSEDPVKRVGEIDADNPPTATTTGFKCSGADPLKGPGHNIAQTDGVKVDVAFYAVQSRHNTGFTCASLNPTPTPTE